MPTPIVSPESFRSRPRGFPRGLPCQLLSTRSAASCKATKPFMLEPIRPKFLKGGHETT
jgi:hypothetical protein